MTRTQAAARIMLLKLWVDIMEYELQPVRMLALEYAKNGHSVLIPVGLPPEDTL